MEGNTPRLEAESYLDQTESMDSSFTQPWSEAKALVRTKKQCCDTTQTEGRSTLLCFSSSQLQLACQIKL
jgi:hypothetical protein